MHRALRLGQRHAKRLAHHFLNPLWIRNAIGPLGNRLHERDLVEVLRGIALAHVTFLHAADADERHVAFVRSGNRRDHIGETGAFGRGNHRRRIARTRKTVRHEGSALLVAREDETNLRRLAQHVEKREVLRARNTEHVIDAFAQQPIDQRA